MKNNELINALYQNTEMGISSIKKIYPQIQNTNLKNEVKKQLSNYKTQHNQITKSMKSNNIVPQKIPLMIKAMTSAGIAFNCAKDNSSSV